MPTRSRGYQNLSALAAHEEATTAAHAASAISFTPNGSIAATDVQAAIQEVRDEAGLDTGAAVNALTGSPTLFAWYKADSIAGNDGDAIGTWADSSGNSRDVTQATPGNKPTLRKTLPFLNGGAALQFDGTGTYLAMASGFGVSSASALTWGAVYYSDGAANSWIMRANGTGTIDLGYESSLLSSRTGSATTQNLVVSTALAKGCHMAVATWDGATQHLWVDGILVARTATVNAVTCSSMTIGSIATTTYPFKGHIAEVFLYTAVLTVAQRNQLTRGLANKYALPIVIPA